jgi:hypothetical protein
MHNITRIYRVELKKARLLADKLHKQFWDFLENRSYRYRASITTARLKDEGEQANALGVSRNSLYQWLTFPVGLHKDNRDTLSAATGTPEALWKRGGDPAKRREAVKAWWEKQKQ